MVPDVRLATDDERTAIASTLGVAFLDDPMIRWPFPANATLTDIAALGAVEHGIRRAFADGLPVFLGTGRWPAPSCGIEPTTTLVRATPTDQ